MGAVFLLHKVNLLAFLNLLEKMCLHEAVGERSSGRRQTGATLIQPHLRETAVLFDQGEENFPKHLSGRREKAVWEAIEKIESAQDRPDLERLK